MCKALERQNHVTTQQLLVVSLTQLPPSLPVLSEPPNTWADDVIIKEQARARGYMDTPARRETKIHSSDLIAFTWSRSRFCVETESTGKPDGPFVCSLFFTAKGEIN